MKSEHIAIFWAEDDEDDVDLIGRYLSELRPDVRFRFFPNGQELISCLASSADLPKVVITDVNMPLVDGFDVLNAIKQNPFSQWLPVVLYSTSEDTVFRTRARHGGAAEYLVKPAGAGEYKNVVQYIVDNYGV